MTLIVDYSHVHRPITGIERISLDMFSIESLTGMDTRHVIARNTWEMVMAQWLRLPLYALAGRRNMILCPGFPPSILLTALGRDRLITYVHDLFLLTRPHDLNAFARYYMRPSFIFAVRKGRMFLVNSSYTQSELERFCSPCSEIRLLRPEVRDVFNLRASSSASPGASSEVVKLVSIGTLEPRKNYRFAAQLRKALADTLGKRVELHIIGRTRWGEDAQWLSQERGVILHGYCPVEQIKTLVQSADVFICTSKEEGLGLPLLEIQHGGILVAATDIPVFRESLADSGCFLPIDSAVNAADALAAVLKEPGWKERRYALARANVERWNAVARQDMRLFIDWLKQKACP